MQVGLVLEGHQIAGFPTTHAVQLRLYVLDITCRHAPPATLRPPELGMNWTSLKNNFIFHFCIDSRDSLVFFECAESRLLYLTASYPGRDSILVPPQSRFRISHSTLSVYQGWCKRYFLPPILLRLLFTCCFTRKSSSSRDTLSIELFGFCRAGRPSKLHASLVYPL